MESLVLFSYSFYSLIHYPFLRIDCDDSWHVVVSLVYRFFSIEMRSLEDAFLLSTLHIQYVHMQSKAETKSVPVAVSTSSPSSLFLILAFNFCCFYNPFGWLLLNGRSCVITCASPSSVYFQLIAAVGSAARPLRPSHLFPFLGSLNNYFVARERRWLWGLAFRRL